MGSKPQDMLLAFDVLTPLNPVSTLRSKKALLNELTQAKLASW